MRERESGFYGTRVITYGQEEPSYCIYTTNSL
jgi:hypothetical protein